MNYLQEKKEILELKLKLTSILIDKKLCIRNQQYEKVADLRDEEKKLLQLEVSPSHRKLKKIKFADSGIEVELAKPSPSASN